MLSCKEVGASCVQLYFSGHFALQNKMMTTNFSDIALYGTSKSLSPSCIYHFIVSALQNNQAKYWKSLYMINHDKYINFVNTTK